MFDAIEEALLNGAQLLVGVAAVVGLLFARGIRRHNLQTQRHEGEHPWRTDVVTGINNYLRARNTTEQPGQFDLRMLQRPRRDPHARRPYYALSGVEINEPAKRVESLASYDIVEPDLVDALVEGLGLLGLGYLTSDRDWLLVNTLLGGAGDDVERLSTDLVPAASVPTAERNKYRFALVRHEPFVVWVYLMDEKASRRKVSREPQWPGCAAHHPHSTAGATQRTPGRTPTPGLGSPRRAARRQPKCECGGIAIGRFLPRERQREPQASSSARTTARRCAQQREVLRGE